MESVIEIYKFELFESSNNSWFFWVFFIGRVLIKYFVWVIILNFNYNFVNRYCLFSFYIFGNGGLERISGFVKVI